MIVETDFKELDQTGWLCFDLGDDSYYYGQVSYLDAKGSPTHEQTSTPIKQGHGVYIYQASKENPVRYEGQWLNDLKHGTGKMVYEDGSVYVGGWKAGQKNEQGRMCWSNGHGYEGGWKADRMDGLGIFKHSGGRTLKGTFKCNHFIEGDSLRNPFLDEEAAREFTERRKNLLKIKEKVSKQQLCFFERVSIEDPNNLKQLIQKSNSNNRVPLIFPSTEVAANISFFDKYSQQLNLLLEIFDLRKCYTTSPQEKEAFFTETARQTSSVLQSGGLLVISLDDSESVYTQKFYPNLKQYYRPDSFPSEIWSKKDMSKKEVYQRLSQEEYVVSPEYTVALWSKYRLPESLGNKEITQKLQRRFETVLPLLKVDYIFLTK